jgi:hypothetical protein
VLAVLAVLALSAPAVAQEHTVVVERQQSGTSNIKLELTINDTYGARPTTKTVSMIVMDGAEGLIRTSNRLFPSNQTVNLNVDAQVSRLRSGEIRVRLTFEYTPPQTSAQEDPQMPLPAQLNESLTVLLQDGQKLVVSQSADPASDRKVTVELSATVLK